MIAFPEMLLSAAEAVNMPVPSDPDHWEEEKDSFPHFFVFCAIQLGKSVRYHGEHFDNARVIAQVPSDRILKVSVNDLMKEGLSF